MKNSSRPYYLLLRRKKRSNLSATGAALIGYTISCLALPALAFATEPTKVDAITVSAPASDNESTESSLGATVIGTSTVTDQHPASHDSARLLESIPGVSLYGAGGISSLPVIHGLADDRLRVQVNDVDP